MGEKWHKLHEFEDIRYERTDDGIAKITINRPKVRNAFRPLTVSEMKQALDMARDDADIGVIVLTGQGKEAFCSGGDQRVRGKGGYVDEKEKIPRLNILDVQKQIRSMPKPVVAMVAGYAIGGGHVLHVVCDLTIAADNARFGQTGPASARSTPASDRPISPASSARRRPARSGSSAGSTTRSRRSTWASSTRSSRSISSKRRR